MKEYLVKYQLQLSLIELTYSNWRRHRPVTTFGNDKDCVAMVYKDNGIVWQDFSCTSPLIKVWNSLDRGKSFGISRYKLDNCFSEKFIFQYNPILILHILKILVMFHDKLHSKLELFKMPRTSSILFNDCESFIQKFHMIPYSNLHIDCTSFVQNSIYFTCQEWACSSCLWTCHHPFTPWVSLSMDRVWRPLLQVFQR